jgi:hypothetical protein
MTFAWCCFKLVEFCLEEKLLPMTSHVDLAHNFRIFSSNIFIAYVDTYFNLNFIFYQYLPLSLKFSNKSCELQRH